MTHPHVDKSIKWLLPYSCKSTIFTEIYFEIMKNHVQDKLLNSLKSEHLYTEKHQKYQFKNYW